jgi:hypothetical protein
VVKVGGAVPAATRSVGGSRRRDDASHLQVLSQALHYNSLETAQGRSPHKVLLKLRLKKRHQLRKISSNLHLLKIVLT